MQRSCKYNKLGSVGVRKELICRYRGRKRNIIGVYCQYLVRNLERKDVSQVVDLTKVGCLEGGSIWKDHQLMDLIKQDGYGFGVVCIDDEMERVVGFIGGIALFEQVQIYEVVVHQEHRRRGIASNLILHIITTLCREEDCSISLEVRESNKSARVLYSKIGFQEEYVRKNYYRDGENAVIMKLSYVSDG
eukprot:TRINITY_DN3397_c0_g1_i4.p1 TRINITY_DN3397_c0_g1~~TRINITY_DN3397_c0_g1_i4.p1  ORF type:complete len:190 (+),score=17.63 TRINITY_DN3397_c0_g1_i4:147-716(+)